MNYKKLAMIFSITSVVLMGLVIYEQHGKLEAQEQARYHAEHYAGALQELNDKAEADVELQACLNDASGDDYCAVEYDQSGEVIDVVLTKAELKG